MGRVLLLVTLLLLAGCTSPPEQAPGGVDVTPTPAAPATPPPATPVPVREPPKWPAAPAPGRAEILFLDVGHSSTAILLLNDVTAIVDLPGSASNGTKRLHEYLDAHKVTRVEALLLTGNEEPGDCSATFRSIIVARLYVPQTPPRTAAWLACLEAAATYKVPIAGAHATDPGTILPLGAFSRLAMMEDAQTLAFRLDVGGTSILFEGAMDCQAETNVAARFDVAADVLVLARHGAADTACTTWLQAVRPEAAILSVGENPNGLPSIATLGRMSSRSIWLHRTDLAGNLSVTLDGMDLAIAPYSIEQAESSVAPGAPSSGGSASGTGNVRIVEITSLSVGEPPRRAGTITVRNDGNGTQDMEGFRLLDEHGNSYFFAPEFELAPDASIKIRYMPAKCGADTDWCVAVPPPKTDYVDLFQGGRALQREPWPEPKP